RARHPELHEKALRSGGSGFDAIPTTAHYSRWIGQETIDFLRTDRLADTPFFFVANFFDPHHGFGAPLEYLDHYHLDEIPQQVTTIDELDVNPQFHAEA